MEDYLLQIPLERTRQIHISGVREKDGFLVDAHETLMQEDYDLLAWALKKVQPEVVTLEYFRDDRDALRQMLFRLREVLDVSMCTE
jgi:uncharacterized protein (UPF0276 family)